MRIAFFGDIVGRAGRRVVAKYVPELRMALRLDAVVANGENAAGGFGITPAIAEQIWSAGVDVITLGNHSFDNPQGVSVIENDPRLLRPCNYPSDIVPGCGVRIYKIDSFALLVVNVLGRVFMDALDDPFQAVDKALDQASLGQVVDAAIVDIHAEATSEKQAMGHFCDGRVSLVIGTHQHVPTADTRILAGGTAYQTDAGMCGDYDSIIGMDKAEPLYRFTTRMRRAAFSPAQGAASLCGVFVETDPQTGLAVRAEPIRLGEGLHNSQPAADVED